MQVEQQKSETFSTVCDQEIVASYLVDPSQNKRVNNLSEFKHSSKHMPRQMSNQTTRKSFILIKETETTRHVTNPNSTATGFAKRGAGVTRRRYEATEGSVSSLDSIQASLEKMPKTYFASLREVTRQLPRKHMRSPALKALSSFRQQLASTTKDFGRNHLKKTSFAQNTRSMLTSTKRESLESGSGVVARYFERDESRLADSFK